MLLHTADGDGSTCKSCEDAFESSKAVVSLMTGTLSTPRSGEGAGSRVRSVEENKTILT